MISEQGLSIAAPLFTTAAGKMMPNYPITSKIDQLCDRFERDYRENGQPLIADYLAEVAAEEQTALIFWMLKLHHQLETDATKRQRWLKSLRCDFPRFESVIHEFDEPKLQVEQVFPQIPGYTLQRLIDTGGQGTVYEAIQERTGQRVAIKLVSAEQLGRLPIQLRKQHIERFDQEIRVSSSLRHRNVVKIYDAGESNAGYYFIMQLIEGGSLASRLSDLTQFEAANRVEAIAGAVQEANTAGILHLDIKPQNILFDEVSNEPLLTDFGLARLFQDETGENAIAGTLGYMAPEQAMGAAVDPRTDVYGLGATLYFLLTGRVPYQGVSLPYSADQREQWQAKPPRTYNRNIAVQLEKICLKCLEIDPRDRYQNCQELAEDLQRFTEVEDSLHIVSLSNRTLLTSPALLLVNLLVFVQLQLGWGKSPYLEPWVWGTMFLMYPIVFYVLRALQRSETSIGRRLVSESLWAVWTAKMYAAMTIAASLRLLVTDFSFIPAPESHRSPENAILMCYPMFSALTGFLLASIAPRFWKKLYLGAAICWLGSILLMFTIAFQLKIAPLIYGWGSMLIAISWGFYLRRLATDPRSGETLSR
jgi:serine/threonine protein kinase